MSDTFVSITHNKHQHTELRMIMDLFYTKLLTIQPILVDHNNPIHICTRPQILMFLLTIITFILYILRKWLYESGEYKALI